MLGLYTLFRLSIEILEHPEYILVENVHFIYFKLIYKNGKITSKDA